MDVNDLAVTRQARAEVFEGRSWSVPSHPHSITCPGHSVWATPMYPYGRYAESNDPFRALLETSLTRGGPSGLAYVEANKYSLKQQLLEVHEVRDHAHCISAAISTVARLVNHRFTRYVVS